MSEKNPADAKEQQQIKDTDTNQEELEQPKEEQTESSADNDTEERIQELEQQLKEAKDKHLYLLSDFENLRKNANKERLELIQTAGRDILTILLPVLDDFERAAQNNGLSEGVALIQHKLMHVLESKGLKSMGVKKGDAFDADHHEAVAEVPGQGDDMKGKVIDVIEQGYLLNERIIRFAKVAVGA